jgi:hypothetical protein
MSAVSGDIKKSQKYKNTKAYKVQFNQKYEEVIKKAPLDRLCARCRDQIEWKINFYFHNSICL